MDSPVIIDASKFSSSGTLLRCVLAFSSITSKPVVIQKILTDRKFPGLDAQKVALIDAFANTTNADVAGNGVGSTIVQFSPKLPFSGKSIEINFSSSTSVSLPLHAFLIAALTSKEKTSISLIGGTHILNAPSVTFIRETLFRYLTPYFEQLSLNIPVIGFYPKGEGGLVCTSISKVSFGDKPRPLNIAPKKQLVALKGELISSNERLESDVLKNINSLVSISLKPLGVPLILQPQYVPSKSSGASMTLAALFGDKGGYDNSLPYIIALDKTWSSLSSVDKDVLEKDCLSLVLEFNSLVSKGFVDSPSVELLLPFIALLGGSIAVPEVSDRLNSIIYAAKEILDIDFEVKDNLISTKGYLLDVYDTLPSIEDV